MICPWCKGKGETFVMYRDPTCRVCKGVGEMNTVPKKGTWVVDSEERIGVVDDAFEPKDTKVAVRYGGKHSILWCDIRTLREATGHEVNSFLSRV